MTKLFGCTYLDATACFPSLFLRLWQWHYDRLIQSSLEFEHGFRIQVCGDSYGPESCRASMPVPPARECKNALVWVYSERSRCVVTRHHYCAVCVRDILVGAYVGTRVLHIFLNPVPHFTFPKGTWRFGDGIKQLGAEHWDSYRALDMQPAMFAWTSSANFGEGWQLDMFRVQPSIKITRRTWSCWTINFYFYLLEIAKLWT